jgi:hypothetical protein
MNSDFNFTYILILRKYPGKTLFQHTVRGRGNCPPYRFWYDQKPRSNKKSCIYLLLIIPLNFQTLHRPCTIKQPRYGKKGFTLPFSCMEYCNKNDLVTLNNRATEISKNTVVELHQGLS